MATLSVPPSEQHAQSSPPRLTAFGGIFGWGAVFLLLAGVLAYVFIVWGGVGHFTDADATRALERQKILKDANDADYKYLHDKPGYFKKDAGLIRVPIDQAIRLTLADLQKIKPHAAYPIAQSPPQNSAAPTSPDKGAGQDAKPAGKTNDNNPPASNPTAAQPATAQAASPTPTPAPSTAPTPVPANTPSTSAGPAATNNASNPGPAPVPGTQAQPVAPPMETNTSGVVTPTPAPSVSAAKPAPLTNPPAQPSPETATTPGSAPGSTPLPSTQEPGASPAGTP